MMWIVLSTSGWQGSRWHVAGFCETRKEARALRNDIQTTDARFNGYITRIVRGGKECNRHESCIVFSKLTGKGEPHLVGRDIHAEVSLDYY